MKLFNSFIHLVYPKICVACFGYLGPQEQQICTLCEYQLPKFEFRFDSENQVKRIFWGRSTIENASALLSFTNNGTVQQLMHEFKYKGNKELGRILGQMMAEGFLTQGFFEDVNAILPVPLHAKKYLKRGFNQSDILANGIASIINKPVFSESVVRQIANPSQTKKSRFERHLNTKNIFATVSENALIGKHLLVVDDVITTGATLESLVNLLNEIEGVRVSVLTLAIAI